MFLKGQEHKWLIFHSPSVHHSIVWGMLMTKGWNDYVLPQVWNGYPSNFPFKTSFGNLIEFPVIKTAQNSISPGP